MLHFQTLKMIWKRAEIAAGDILSQKNVKQEMRGKNCFIFKAVNI